MKKLLLILTLLFTTPVFAVDTFEELLDGLNGNVIELDPATETVVVILQLFDFSNEEIAALLTLDNDALVLLAADLSDNALKILKLKAAQIIGAQE